MLLRHKPTWKEYNELVRQVNRISNLKGRGGITVNDTPHGRTIVGKDLIGGGKHLLVFFGSFDSFGGDWTEVVRSSGIATFSNLASPEQGNFVTFSGLQITAGRYDLVVGHSKISNNGIQHWSIGEQTVAEIDGFKPSTPEINSLTITDPFLAVNDSTKISMTVSSKNEASSGFRADIGFFLLRAKI